MRKSSITTFEMLDYFVRISGEKPALKQDSRQLSYAQWNEQSLVVANALAKSGIGPGDRVAVLTFNRIEQFVILYATMKLGAVYVPVNYRLAPAEFKYILNQSESKAIFIESDELTEKIESIADETSLSTFVRLDDSESLNGRWQSFSSLISKQDQTPVDFEPKPDTPVYQMYTSGTTGFPKGVIVTQQQSAAFVVHSLWIPPRVDAGKPHLAVAPIFHAGALCSSIMALCAGRPVHILKDFNPQVVVEELVKEKIADVMLVPAMLHAILQYVPNLHQYDFGHLEKIIYGASPITVDVLERSMKAFGCCFQQGFGMTETVASATALTADDHLKAINGRPELLRSCGRAGLFVDIKIVDTLSRQELPQGEIGEIAVRAPHVMEGYSKQPEKTAEVLDEDGWYYSGDGGYIDQDGYVFIKDRIKDMIVSGGENVYPAEVENVLMSHPDIIDVAVIGLPDEKFGEAVVAICVASPDAGLDPAKMIEYCRAHIAGYKIPRRYERIETLPRNPSGKILKRELRDQFL
ncbi:long-chain-fatty-acid--CoA ligase [Spongiibacter sp. KMU-166]|uniref:Long-chain-fatty-acid--CoA ligase n=1 Tax=Spongiibacter thalassae TaxID=2721624 RepID=A0ABX1GBJ8_9GAMM|nr:long-chain-fatty-acid--CoA ligase [Spongiibacter thalassae]NKI15877.1 long-chain-fatty-acid--CoA ligase [Spongiibacter thalassae]